MIIIVAQIPEDGLDLDITLPVDDIDLSNVNGSLETDVEYKGSVHRFSTGCIVSGTVRSAWKLPCARCLETFSFPVSEEFRIFLTRELTEDEDEEIDMDVSELLSDEINLIHILREQLILQIPMKPICSQSCRGLCSSCGNNLNSEDCNCDTTSIDPRLKKLKELKDLMDK